MQGDDVYNQAIVFCPAKALKHNVASVVHPNDFIFKFLLGNPVFQNLEPAVAYYFDDGARSAAKLKELLQDICGWKGEPFNLLEFASGYGCVTRHLHNVLPEATVTSCDIHTEAVKFLADYLSVKTLISDSQPEKLAANDDYDIVFALSFFSHMPVTTWTQWFDSLLSRVKPGGYLIFTTHGWLSRRHFAYPQFNKDGFWFRQDSEQKDLDTAEYGQAVVEPRFVFHEAAKNSSGRIVNFQEAFWWTHQDVYIVKRETVLEAPGVPATESNLRTTLARLIKGTIRKAWK